MGLALLPESPRGRLAHLLLLLLLGGLPEGEGPERPPGLLLLGLRALVLHAAATALVVGRREAPTPRAVDAVAVRAVGALVTLGPDIEEHGNIFWRCEVTPGAVGEVSPGIGFHSKKLLVASKAHHLHELH